MTAVGFGEAVCECMRFGHNSKLEITVQRITMHRFSLSLSLPLSHSLSFSLPLSYSLPPSLSFFLSLFPLLLFLSLLFSLSLPLSRPLSLSPSLPASLIRTHCSLVTVSSSQLSCILHGPELWVTSSPHKHRCGKKKEAGAGVRIPEWF